MGLAGRCCKYFCSSLLFGANVITIWAGFAVGFIDNILPNFIDFLFPNYLAMATRVNLKRSRAGFLWSSLSWWYLSAGFVILCGGQNSCPVWPCIGRTPGIKFFTHRSKILWQAFAVIKRNLMCPYWWMLMAPIYGEWAFDPTRLPRLRLEDL